MIGRDIHAFASKLWAQPRSITGAGLRETLDSIKELLPNLTIHAIPTGTKVFDWEIPQEWHVTEAYIITPGGERICDFATNNLHLVGYSIPFQGDINLEQLKSHLYTLPEQPDAIPYVTSYY